MPQCYEQNFEVFHFECDPWDRMKPGAVLRRVQEIGTDQCELLGIDEAIYRRTHTVFLLSRLSLLMRRMPMVDERIRLQTRAYGMRRAVYHRVTSLYSEAGGLLCETDGRWVLVDTRTRRILRKPQEEFLPYFNEEPSEGHPREGTKYNGEITLTPMTAGYSICDRNGHINNSRYADLACDALPLEKLKAGPPRQMLLNYRSEITLGDPFEWGSAAVGDNGFYCAAVQGETRKFECFVTF
jgi:acyl-ACP thioesterase